MSIHNFIILICWLVFIAVWFAASLYAKKNTSVRASHWWVRFGILVIVLAVSSIPGVSTFLSRHDLWLHNQVIKLTGDILCVLGISLAIWARAYLGKNWGMPMSVKDSPELVTTGPYRYVRHPIYSGGILALVGSGLVIGYWYLALALLFAIYFAYSAKVEEKVLLKTFGESYADYMRRSKMIIPFIL